VTPAPYLVPPALKPGDLIWAIAPAGAFDRALFFRGLAWLRQHFRVGYDADIFARAGGSAGCAAGSSERRLREINSALRSDAVRAIWCARGGYGSSEISPLCDYQALRERPKLLIGFSDITALHCELSRFRIASLHAANITGLGLGWEPLRRATLQAVLDPYATRRFESLETLYPGDALGPAIGGNLTLFLQEASLGRTAIVDGAVLFLEEVNEAPYRIARQLAALERLGAFDRIAALVMCQASNRHEQRDESYRSVLTDFARRVRVPLRWGFPAGHYLRRNEPILFGAPVAVRGEQVILNP
jgi:muramoyltetrapeptide carboxypeptidase